MHGGDIYNNRVDLDFSVNLNPYFDTKEAYPDPDQTAVRKALADSEGVDLGQVYAGCGASELLMAASLSEKPERALLIEPCFSGYRHVLRASGCENIKQFFLKEEDGFILNSDMLTYLTDDVDILFLADPNNPTGRNIPDELLYEILDRALERGIKVVLDESFITLSEGYLRGRSAALINKYDNLYIIKSYTKSFSLPGVRMGYVMSKSLNIERIRTSLPEWNLPSVSASVMEACARLTMTEDIYEGSMKLIRREREYLSDGLTALGFTVFDSDSVFLLVKGSEGLYEKLLERRILIRKCDDYEGLTGNFYRFAVRSHKDNEQLLNTLKQLIK